MVRYGVQYSRLGKPCGIAPYGMYVMVRFITQIWSWYTLRFATYNISYHMIYHIRYIMPYIAYDTAYHTYMAIVYHDQVRVIYHTMPCGMYAIPPGMDTILYGMYGMIQYITHTWL